ncbi:MAG: hypothetical protein NTY68_05695, partial [Candidatus Micrarchaeota archaeon]|nr:hypothetical protein [Candidatus Micrarchaeota archaeon]
MASFNMFRRAAISSILAAQIGIVGVPVAAFAAEKYKEAGENMAGDTTVVKRQEKDRAEQQKLANSLKTANQILYGGLLSRLKDGSTAKSNFIKLNSNLKDNQDPNSEENRKLAGLFYNIFTASKSDFETYIANANAMYSSGLKKTIPAKKEGAKETAEKAVVSPKKALADAAEGETIWTNEYYPSVKTSSSSLQFSSAYSNSTAIPQDAAAALLSYSNTVNECGVASSEEKKTISTTAVMLYGADPSLLSKYFKAAENLAELCRNQPNEYRKALDLLTVMIDTKTSSIYSANVTQQLPVQKTAHQISNALDEIIKIKAGDMYKLNRLSLMDRNVYISGYPPYNIQQRASGWESSLLEGNRESAGLYQSTYMFPYRIYLPTNMPYSRSMVGTDIRGGGTVMFPNIPLNYQVQPQPGLVGTSFKYYLYPEVRASGARGRLPVTPIAPIGLAGLSDEIRAAFVQAEAPDYDLKVRGGGAYGVASKEAGGGLVGSLATKEGGAAAGLGIAPGGDIDFAGLNMVAIPLVTGKAEVTSQGTKGPAPVRAAIEDFTTGWEKMDDGTKKALLQSISSIYNEKNPKDIVLLASSSANETGEWSAGRGYLITKKGDVFELAGGADTFNKLLNYIANYGNENSIAVPTTYAWNVENKLNKGGAVLAMDLSNVPVLFQFQDVPSYMGSGQKFVTWTAAGGTTIVPKKGAANIHEISLPGTLYRIRGGEITSQHVNYSMRHIEEEKRWEFDAGGTAGKSTLGKENKAFQGAGFLMKWEEGEMNKRMAQRGFGITTQRL